MLQKVIFIITKNLNLAYLNLKSKNYNDQTTPYFLLFSTKNTIKFKAALKIF